MLSRRGRRRVGAILCRLKMMWEHVSRRVLARSEPEGRSRANTCDGDVSTNLESETTRTHGSQLGSWDETQPELLADLGRHDQRRTSESDVEEMVCVEENVSLRHCAIRQQVVQSRFDGDEKLGQRC